MAKAELRIARKRRSTKFVPSALSSWGARLEARALTAPAIWRRPSTDPAGSSDGVTAQAGNQNDQQVSSAQAGDQASVTDGVSTTTVVESATTQITDLVNPPAPSAPVGSYGVSFSTTEQLQFGVSGPTPGPFLMGTAAANGQRAWVLADDVSASNPPATLVETYHVHLTTGPTAGAVVANTRLVTPSMTVVVGVNVFTINGTAYAQGTNTITGPTGSIRAVSC